MADPNEGVSVIVPAWNEEAGIGETLSALKEALAAAGREWEVIVVDDGSSDRTAEIASAAGVVLVRHAVNIGYGRSLQDGMRLARFPWIATVDADGTYPVRELPRLVSELGDCAMVVGARQGPAYRGSLLRNPARFAFRWLAEFASGTRIPDINSGMRVFRKESADAFLDTLPNGFSFPTTLTLAFVLNGLGVRYLPVDYAERKGVSKVRLVRDTLRAAQAIVTSIVLYNPLKIFLLLAALCCIVSAVFSIVACVQGGAFTLLAGEALLVAFLVFAIGLHAIRAGGPPGRRGPPKGAGA